MFKPKYKIALLVSLSSIGFACYFITNFLFRFFQYDPNKISNKSSDILLLAIKSSGGHMSAANAIKAKMKSLGYESDLLIIDDYDPLILGPAYENLMTSLLGRTLINKVICRTYWNTGSYYISWLFALLKEYLEVNNYKCIISVMPLTYKLVDYTFKTYNRQIPFVIIPTDWSDPELGTGFWIDGPNALYILGTQKLWDQCPVEYKKIQVNGMILRESFVKDIKSKTERRAELNLPQDKPIILFLFGKCASYDMIRAALVLRNKTDYHVVFVCGSNTGIKENIEAIKNEFKCEHYTVYGFIDTPHKLMQACDVFVGKPGPGALTEAMYYKMPILYSKNSTLMQEVYNGQYIEETGLGVGYKEFEEIPVMLDQIIANKEKYIKAYEKVLPNTALSEIAEIVSKLIEEQKVVS